MFHVVWNLDDMLQCTNTLSDDPDCYVSIWRSRDSLSSALLCGDPGLSLDIAPALNNSSSSSEKVGVLSKDVPNHSSDECPVNGTNGHHSGHSQNSCSPHTPVPLLCFDAILAGLVIQECHRSTAFRKGFRNYARSCTTKGCLKISPNDSLLQDNSDCSAKKTSPISCDTQPIVHSNTTVIKLHPPKTSILDYKWCYRLVGLAIRRHQLDDTMNWLNTLGGGYSALGDYFHQHAKQAGHISHVQLRLALELGEAPVILRCHLYMALSNMQTANLSLAKKIIRITYRSAQQLPVRDHRLEAMCHGLWNKLRYLRHKYHNVSIRDHKYRSQTS